MLKVGRARVCCSDSNTTLLEGLAPCAPMFTTLLVLAFHNLACQNAISGTKRAFYAPLCAPYSRHEHHVHRDIRRRQAQSAVCIPDPVPCSAACPRWTHLWPSSATNIHLCRLWHDMYQVGQTHFELCQEHRERLR